MKRSEINRIMRESLDFLRRMNFHLPPFATWTPEEWRQKGSECRDIYAQQLGWDITDFGSVDYEKIGLFLFTIRNGTLEDSKRKGGKTYAEKILIVQPEQITPTHFHYQKMEDIINRGGGDLLIEFWNSTRDDKPAGTDVTISTDSVKYTIKAGDTITLTPGESVCIQQHVYHKFWGKKGKGTVLVGEVSRVNDDHVDNHFFDPIGRFPEIEEDESPLYLLYEDYRKYYKFASS